MFTVNTFTTIESPDNYFFFLLSVQCSTNCMKFNTLSWNKFCVGWFCSTASSRKCSEHAGGGLGYDVWQIRCVNIVSTYFQFPMGLKGHDPIVSQGYWIFKVKLAYRKYWRPHIVTGLSPFRVLKCSFNSCGLTSRLAGTYVCKLRIGSSQDCFYDSAPWLSERGSVWLFPSHLWGVYLLPASLKKPHSARLDRDFFWRLWQFEECPVERGGGLAGSWGKPRT